MSGRKGAVRGPARAPTFVENPVGNETNHAKNTANGLKLLRMNSFSLSAARGSASGLAIAEVSYADFATLAGPNLGTVVSNILADDDGDWMSNGTYRRSDHRDDLGNLPNIAGTVAYREYWLDGNTFPTAGYLRLVADVANGRLYATPTHYDVWLLDDKLGGADNMKSRVNPKAVSAQSPYFRLTGVPHPSNLFG